MLLIPERHQHGINGYIIMFAKDDLNSFNTALIILEKLFKMNGCNKPIVLVENKCDLSTK